MSALTQPSIGHLIAGLATIGALAALAATGTISGGDALGPIVAIGGFMAGVTGANSSSSPTPTPTPTPPAAAPAPMPAPSATPPAPAPAIASAPPPAA